MTAPSIHPPSYTHGSLPDVLPAVAASLGVDVGLGDRPNPLTLAPAQRSVVVLLDGLGDRLLRRRAGHAPFLRSLLHDGAHLDCGFPSTTATSMGSFGTGLPPGEHGLLGYQMLIPGTDVVFDHLSWDRGPNPRTWQPETTMFERLEPHLEVVRIGLPRFDGSGLTTAVQRGGRFVGATSLGRGVDAALAVLRYHRRALVYLYWADIDKVGHESGVASRQWGNALEEADAQLRRLAERLPDDASLHITADHGMVDIPFDQRLDLAREPDLDAGIRHMAGEPRAPHLHTVDGAADDVAAAWRARFGNHALVRHRDEAIAEGWFGHVADRNRSRIGDVVVAFDETLAVEDSRTSKPVLLTLLGMHASMTPDEVAVPLLSVPPRSQ